MSNKDIHSKLVLLATQINGLLLEVYFEERKQNSSIETLNHLIKRIFRTAATIDIVANWNLYPNMETIKAAIEEQYMTYFYALGEEMQPTIQM